MRSGSLALCCAISLLAISCGDAKAGFSESSGGAGGMNGSGGSSSTGKAEIPFSSLPRELASTYCAIFQECFGTYNQLVPQADCLTRLTKLFGNGWFSATQAALDAGAVVYDPVKARACVDALAAERCDLFTARNPAVCDQALAGDVALGGPCSIGAECAGDAYCEHATDTCPGVCAVRRAADQDCSSDEECVSGLTCQSEKCRAPAVAGHACGGGSEPECRAGLVCLGEMDTAAGTCADTATVTSGKLGDSCEIAAQKLCDPTLSCRLVTVTPAAFTCQAKSKSGGACSLGLPEPCPVGEYCKTESATPLEGVCTALPGVGEPCVSGGIHLLTCQVGLVCASGTCRAIQENSGSCAENAECASAHCKNGTCQGDEFCTP